MASSDAYRDRALQREQQLLLQIQETANSQAEAEAELGRVDGQIEELQSRVDLEKAEHNHLTRKIQSLGEEAANLQALRENFLRFLEECAPQGSATDEVVTNCIPSNDRQERLSIRGRQNDNIQPDRPGQPIPGGASRVSLTTRNESLIESEYWHIIKDNDRWLELSCKYCGANARSDLQRYLYRESGFISHISRTHIPDKGPKLNIHNIRNHCNVRVLDPADVERIHRGERPAHEITMRFPPKDANTIQFVENGDQKPPSGQTIDGISEASVLRHCTPESDRNAAPLAQTDTFGFKRVREAEPASAPVKQRRKTGLRSRPSTSYSQYFNSVETDPTNHLNLAQDGNGGSVGSMRRRPNPDNDEYVPERA